MNSSVEDIGAMVEYARLSYTQEKYKEPTKGHFPDATYDNFGMTEIAL